MAKWKNGRPARLAVGASRGCELLLQWLEDHGIGQTDLAHRIGITRNRVARIMRCERQIQPHEARLIRELTGIEIEDWN